MAPSEKKNQFQTEVTNAPTPAPVGQVDVGDRIGLLENRVFIIESDNGDLKRALSERSAELKEALSDLRVLEVRFDEANDRTEQLGRALAGIVAGSITAGQAPVAPIVRDPKGPVPAGFFRNKRGLIVAEEYRGEKKYELSETAFVAGVLRQPGDRIVVVDEQPGTTWRPLVTKVEEQLVAAPTIGTQRAADRVV